MRVRNNCALDPAYPNPTFAIHSIYLHTGRILCIDELEGAPPSLKAEVVLVNPVVDPNCPTIPDIRKVHDGTFNNHDLFCSGHARLADGRLVIRGGGEGACPDSDFETTVYVPDPAGGIGELQAGPNESWEQPGDSVPSEVLRWYPTATTLGNGNILITDGACPTNDFGFAHTPVILEIGPGAPSSWIWTALKSARYGPHTPGTPPPPYAFYLRTYPFMFQLADGTLFMAGANELDPPTGTNLITRKLDVSDDGEWISSFQPQSPIAGGSAALYQRRDAADVVYTVVMKAGGHVGTAAPYTPTDRAAEIVVSDADPTWSELSAMNIARKDLYLAPLPDGTIVAVGGAAGTRPDRFKPYTSTWSGENPLATMTVGREYHSSGVLLIDGSIFVAGGGSASYQIYRPPYFFAAARPTITSAPATPGYGTTFTITTSNGLDVKSVRAIRLGSATHSFDHDARMLDLKIVSRTTGTVRAKAPQHSNLAPPGYHMLFIATGTNGTLPSTGRLIRFITIAPT